MVLTEQNLSLALTAIIGVSQAVLHLRLAKCGDKACQDAISNIKQSLSDSDPKKHGQGTSI